MHIHLSSESSDICRLLASPRSLPILSSSLLHSLRRPPYLPSYSSLSLFLYLFHSFLLSFSLFLSFLLSFSVPSLLIARSYHPQWSFARRCGSSAGARGMPDAAGSIAYDVDCQNLGESPGEIPLTRRLPIEYSTYDLATLLQWLAAPSRAELRRAASVGRRERGNVRAASSGAPGDLTRSSTFVLRSGQLPGRSSVRDARARTFERTATSCFFIVVWYAPLVDDPSFSS